MNKDFQERTLAFLLREDQAMGLFEDIVSQDHFTEPSLKAIFSLALIVWQRSGRMPTLKEFLSLIDTGLPDDPQQPLLKGLIKQRIQYLYTMPLQATSYEVSRYLVMGELESLRREIRVSSVAEVDSALEKFREKLERLDPLLSATAGHRCKPLQVKDFDLDLRWEGEVIPYPWKSVNRLIRGGGSRKGELVVLLAPTGTGKTSVLVDLQVYWAEQGYKVLALSIDNLRGEWLDRTEARITRLSMDAEKDARQVQNLLKSWLDLHKNNLFLEEAAPYQMKTADVLRMVRRYKKLHNIDILIIDYGELLLSRRKYNEVRHETNFIFTDLKGIAKSERILVVAATQSNAKALKQDTLDLDNFAEGFARSWHCNLGLGIAQKEEELRMDPPRARLTILKNTRGKKKVEIPVLINYGICHWTEDPQGKITEIVRTRKPADPSEVASNGGGRRRIRRVPLGEDVAPPAKSQT